MIDWVVAHLWAVGFITFILMWSGCLLTILQERERQLHYAEHYQSYPWAAVHGLSSPYWMSDLWR
jgi:hypothetical protein